uniref:Uncharacterized protein n=1 Tax=Arundo donax TaxID=35708 RepID=A0A0A9CSZ3_ARUDO
MVIKVKVHLLVPQPWQMLIHFQNKAICHMLWRRYMERKIFCMLMETMMVVVVFVATSKSG